MQQFHALLPGGTAYPLDIGIQLLDTLRSDDTGHQVR